MLSDKTTPAFLQEHGAIKMAQHRKNLPEVSIGGKQWLVSIWGNVVISTPPFSLLLCHSAFLNLFHKRKVISMNSSNLEFIF
jgi:hypothetical protein